MKTTNNLYKGDVLTCISKCRARQIKHSKFASQYTTQLNFHLPPALVIKVFGYSIFGWQIDILEEVHGEVKIRTALYEKQTLENDFIIFRKGRKIKYVHQLSNINTFRRGKKMKYIIQLGPIGTEINNDSNKTWRLYQLKSIFKKSDVKRNHEKDTK